MTDAEKDREAVDLHQVRGDVVEGKTYRLVEEP